MSAVATEGTKVLTEDASSPAKLGFKMPAEWERHKQCWMGWPNRPDNWRDAGKPAQKSFAAVATAISKFEKITVCANADQVGPHLVGVI